MGRTLRKRTFLKKGKKITKKRKKKLNIRSKGTLIKKKFTKKKKRKKKLNIKSSRKYKGGFWTTCDKCMRKEKCIGRACMNDCGYCTIQAFELPGINELFRDHQYYYGLTQQAFITRVNKWLKNEGYNNLTVRENTIGSDTPQPSQVAKFLRDNGGDNEFIPICLGWPDGVAGHWLVGGRVNGEAVIIEPQQNPNNMEGKDFEAYAKKNHRSKTVTIGLREEKNLGLAQAKIYVWTQDKHDFIEQNTGENYFVVGKPLSRLTYYTIVGKEKDGAHNIEHKIIKTRDGIEIRIRESHGNGNVDVGGRVIRGNSYRLEDEDEEEERSSSSGETKSNNNTLKCSICKEFKPLDKFSKTQKSKGSSRKCMDCVNHKSEPEQQPHQFVQPPPPQPQRPPPLPSSNITNMDQVLLLPQVGGYSHFPIWDLYCGTCEGKMVSRNHTPGVHTCDHCQNKIYNACMCCSYCDIDYCPRCICVYCGQTWEQHIQGGSRCAPLSRIPKPGSSSAFFNGGGGRDECQNCRLGQSYHFNYNNTTWCPYTFQMCGNNS
jgi:hypothetical protein